MYIIFDISRNITTVLEDAEFKLYDVVIKVNFATVERAKRSNEIYGNRSLG